MLDSVKTVYSWIITYQVIQRVIEGRIFKQSVQQLNCLQNCSVVFSYYSVC